MRERYTAAARAFAIALALVALGACAGLRPITASELAAVAAGAESPSCVRRRCEVTIETREHSGTYALVLVARPGPVAAGRLQLLPPVGGKVLDLAFDASRVSGYFPLAGVAIDHERGTSKPPRHVLSFVAASVLEDLTPLDASRVRGVREVEGSGGPALEVHAEGALEGTRVVALVAQDGRVLERRFTLRSVSWREQRDGGARVFRSRGFAWRMGPVSEESVPDPGPALFRLDVGDAAIRKGEP